ncbi:MAG TPA: PSD1 and planctomycete cytochrome C domain-containing protein [Pirellulales bacterium]|nr:PSD1 and planctomycete cytochrome C domain-containing protein [Pirellulales bacterium]
MPRIELNLSVPAGLLMALAMLWPLVASAATPAAPVVFDRDVLPILSDNCFHCHGPDGARREAELRLDERDSALRKTDPVIVPGHPGDSELVRRVLSADPDEVMPPPGSHRSLSGDEKKLLARWVDQGATWSRHWAYELPKRPALPAVRDTAWSRGPIDRFVLARLEGEGLSPSPEAAQEALIRRATLDLTGLPPTLEEIDAFLADPSPGAYERVVDRLLASPRYGERMAWDWLDAARYADTNGYQGDQERTMWPWRDWVIEQLNANLPFDRFTVEQLAGDLLADASNSQKIATAFLRNHMINGEGGRIAEENRVEYVMDQAETTATVWLGVTMTCCRCHDHKFDPFTQRDYYRLFAFFNQTPVTGQGRSGQTAPVVDLVGEAQLQQRVPLAAELKRVNRLLTQREKQLLAAAEIEKDGKKTSSLPPNIEKILIKGITGRREPDRRELRNHFEAGAPDYVQLLKDHDKAREALDSYSKSLPKVMVMEDLKEPRETFMLTRGAYDKPGEKVTAGVPQHMPQLSGSSPANRLALAQWLVDARNPLPARVTVNRWWQMFFGTGLIKTSEDLGVQGERPSHPELLDWLAVELIESGWNVKALQRQILTSAAYRQRCQVSPELAQRDPENRLLARGPRYRLPAWMLRDQALAVSGLLVEKLGGPSVKTYQPEGIWEEASFGKIEYKQDHGDALYRRSLYIFWRRIVGPTMFFDVASRQTCTVKTARTNTPLQALVTLNDTTYAEAARALAQRVLKAAGNSPQARIEMAFRLCTARRPGPRELKLLEKSLARLEKLYRHNRAAAERLVSIGEAPRDKELDVREHAAYAALCSLVLNLDETLNKP